MDLSSYFAVQHQMFIHRRECWALSGFKCCLACFYGFIVIESAFSRYLIV